MSAPLEPPGREAPPKIHDHQLLRLIGKGSYGEVWLARNVMGTYRAVKIIYRRSFEHLRPYEREFEGIKRYEPVSRGHPNQVAILQAGRDEADQHYYYVMELADDANAPPGVPASPDRHQLILSAAEYLPRTLSGELRKRKRLSLDDCLSVGLALAAAVENLHKNKLIHRDIKPANVIFVNGVPKLADIGLVAEKDSTSSFVGTRGYFPPEGPGTAQADLYSLGKLLYELSTGKDRNEFPDLPEDLEEITEEERLLEFNEILLKACHGDVRQRYRSAQELVDDLAFLQSGKSLTRKRSRERLAAGLRRFAIIGGLFAFAGLAGFVVARRSTRPNTSEPEPIPVHHPEFWSESWFLPIRRFDCSPDGRRILFCGKDGFSIWDRTTTVTRPVEFAGLGTFKQPAAASGWQVRAGSAAPRWAPDSQHFVFQAFKAGAGQTSKPETWALFLGNAERGAMEQIGPELPAGEHAKDICWFPDGTAVTYLDVRRRLHTLGINGMRTPWPTSDLPRQADLFLGGYSPEGKWLVLSHGTTVDKSNERDISIVRHLGGTAQPIVQRGGFDGYPTWGPEGHTVYFVSAGGRPFGSTRGVWKIAIDAGTGVPLRESEQVLARRGQSILHPCFTGATRSDLTYLLDEPNTRIWVANSDDFKTARELTRGQHATLSPDGMEVYYVDEPAQRGVYAVEQNGQGTPRKVTELLPIEGEGQAASGISVSPDGKFIAMLSFDGKLTGIFRVPTHAGEARLLDSIEFWEPVLPVWSPDGKWLAYAVGKVLYRISTDGRVREPLAQMHRWLGWQISWSPDGNYIAAFAYAKPEDWENRASVCLLSVREKLLRVVSDVEGEKDGLSWHPDSQRFTFHVDGPKGANIMMAYTDGRPSKPLIQQELHWDYVGTWSPDGLQFFFISNGCSEKRIHTYNDRNGEIRHAVRSYLPRWSQNGRSELWMQPGESLRHFEIVANFARARP